MPQLFAMDGCPKGWLVVSQDRDSNAQPSARIIPNLEALQAMLGPADLVAIDMPIGLLEADKVTHSRRPCDLEARRLLGRRACCVFYAPARGVLEHLKSPEKASAWHKRHTGKGLSRQACGILGKVKELDAWLRQHTALVPRVHEVHPEVCFAHWAGSDSQPRPLQNGKKTAAGRTARRHLIEAQWPGVLAAASESLGHKSSGNKQRWQEDDLLDALAALWSLRRIAAGQAIPYPQTPTQDAHGLPLCIWA